MSGVSSMFSSRAFIVLYLMFKSLIHLELILCEYPVFPSPFVEETVLFPLCSLGTHVEDHLVICATICFWALYFVSAVLHICHYTNTTLSWSLLLCSMFWNLDVNLPVLLFFNIPFRLYLVLFWKTLRLHMNHMSGCFVIPAKKC